MDQYMNPWVIMFTGQGSQQIGMGQDTDHASSSKAVWDCASDLSGFDVRRMCWKGPMNKLAHTRYQQVAITAVNLASYYALKAGSLLPDDAILIGHSIGEYSALHASGVLDLETTFKVVNARALGMQTQAECTDGAMYVVKDGACTQVKALIARMGLDGQVVIANDNSPRQVVIAGETGLVKQVSIELSAMSLPTIKLPVNGAWHSPLMDGMLADYASLLKGLHWQMPVTPILMNRTAQAPGSINELRHNLTHHLVETVRWRETIETLLQRQHTQFLEIGPRKVLCGLVADCDALGASVRSHCLPLLRVHLPRERPPAAMQTVAA